MKRITKKDIVAAVCACERDPDIIDVHSEQVFGEPRFYHVMCGHKAENSVHVENCACSIDGSNSEKTMENRAQYVHDAWEQKRLLSTEE